LGGLSLGEDLMSCPLVSSDLVIIGVVSAASVLIHAPGHGPVGNGTTAANRE